VAQTVAARTEVRAARAVGSVAARNAGSVPIRTFCTAQKLMTRMAGLSWNRCSRERFANRSVYTTPGWQASAVTRAPAAGDSAAIRLAA
jgi:hypothetical protein